MGVYGGGEIGARERDVCVRWGEDVGCGDSDKGEWPTGLERSEVRTV